jgi:uncharacterized protein YndB with AHSA1/START domain
MSHSKKVVERTYRAHPKELWELWTTNEGFRAHVYTIEAREGGELHYNMIAATPEMIRAMEQMGRPLSHETRGQFAEFRPYERLTLVHVIDFLPGVKRTIACRGLLPVRRVRANGGNTVPHAR